jgi:tRNA-dihydrouridine synthase
MRKGIDGDHLTYLEAGRIAEGAGVASMALHARTAAEFYSGHADWSAIARLKETVTSVPVLGNGDIWSADDAVRMMRETGCDGVVVGRGCLGRPWLFGDLASALGGSDVPAARPSLGEVARAFRRHAELLVEFFGDDRDVSARTDATTRRDAADSPARQGPWAQAGVGTGEHRACRDIRKHVAWYFKGYGVGGTTRSRLAQVESLAELDELLATLELDQPYPGEAAEGQRGRAGSPKSPALPDRWLESRTLDTAAREHLAGAELDTSGG